ncbi:MAG: c-type cytochrome [Chitinophagales bacterium]|nr:c-type cytochrome [Chitinophagales bacterium]
MLLLMFFLIFGVPDFGGKKNAPLTVTPAPPVEKPKSEFWEAPDENLISDEEVKYGRELIAHTGEYLGPKGKVQIMTNGMNCQNCHLDAGTKIFGNNYSAVASTYPKFRARSGTEESIEKRVNDCMERSLNGMPLDTGSREMKAMVAYIKWLGKDVPKGESPKGSGLVDVPFLDRAADPAKGKLVYDAKCASCHQANGEGLLNDAKTAYTYPPLWGDFSYNNGAGLFRLSRFAGYVKANMPLGANHANPQLSDEEAWDVAAFVNSQPRPKKDLRKDWPDISKKPIDHPFGPYSDSFNEKQHKYGPFAPIKKAAEEKKKTS